MLYTWNVTATIETPAKAIWNPYTYDEWLSDLEALPASEQKGFVYESLREKHMLHIFGRYFFPTEIPEGSDVPDIHHDIIREVSSPESSAVIVPRGHGKTTWVRIDIIHDIVYKHELFLVLIGATLEDSKQSFSYVKGQLETNEVLTAIFGDLVPQIRARSRRKWSDKHFETANGVVCIARGAGKGRGLNIKGRRPSKIVIDDLEDDKSVLSEVQRRKLNDWFYRVVVPSLDRTKGRFKMIGTVLHYDCLVLKVWQKYGGIRRAALEDEEGKPSLDGKPIWPERFSLYDLLKGPNALIVQMGTFNFSQEYQNDPMNDENSPVKMAWIKRITEFKLYDGNTQLWKFYSCLDPKVKKNQTNDEAAIVTVAKKIKVRDDEPLRLVVVNIAHGNWQESTTVDNCAIAAARYNHTKFGVESVAFSELYREKLGGAGIASVAVNPKSQDKMTRLLRITGLIQFGNIEFMPGTEDLVTQLLQFPNGVRDDLVDAFVYAVELARGSGGTSFYESVG